jgi:hypothetical protein
MSNTTTNEITITRALAQLKTLSERIDNTLEKSVLITYKHRGNIERNMTEHNLQKVRDLIAYRKRLKAAIVKSNANTTVSIDGDCCTVAEAIERKSSIDLEKRVLLKMKRELAEVTRTVESHNQQVQKKLDRLLEVEFGKDQVKSNVENMETISESYLRNNRAEIIDPLRIEEKITQLEENILKFESEVDLVLSESNAITKIYVIPSASGN